jgi:hypothetical protein
MSAQTITMKFKDVNVKQITCESVKMGKDTVPLIRYGTDKKHYLFKDLGLKCVNMVFQRVKHYLME